MPSDRAEKRRRWQERGPSAKQMRLAQFASLRCSEASLVSIVNILREQRDLIDELETAPLAESAHAFAAHLSRCPITLDMQDGSTFDWHVADFGLALKFFSKHSANFRNLLSRCYTDHPRSPDRPWGAVVYNDEAVPGAVLRIDNRRKMVCFYVSVREWGPKSLVHEASWFPLAFLRHDVAKRVRGKLSAVVKLFLRRMLLGEHNLREAGVLVDEVGEGGSPALLFISVSNLLYDESACNATLSTKGANGLFPCVCCKNVYGCLAHQADDGLALHDPTGLLVDITCGDPRRFDARSDEDLWHAADILQALQGDLTRAQFAEQEKLFGLNWNNDGILWDSELRPFLPPISVQTYDPAHVFF